MADNRSTSIYLCVLPQNTLFQYNKHYEGNKIVYSSKKMKDNLKALRTSLLTKIIPTFTVPELIYENTETSIGGIDYKAAFCFITDMNIVTRSKKSNKVTTIKLYDKLYATTLNISESTDLLKNYLKQLFEQQQKEEVPQWIEEIIFYDDVQQKATIQDNEEIINQAKEKISQATICLQNNKLYKSILYTNGDELVEVVFRILEKLLDYDLSEFVDLKKEDFLIKKQNYTLIGEIKGITSNVKNENIAQLENHYQQYMDQLQENGQEENVHQVLIINPLRSKPLCEREPVHENQIKLAKRNESLIIETKTLLKLFEAYLQGKITIEDCEKLFISKIGLFEEKDFI